MKQELHMVALSFIMPLLLELIGKGEVLGIDIDIREHNKKKIEEHPDVQKNTHAGRLIGDRRNG